jgi:hypothetical protein
MVAAAARQALAVASCLARYRKITGETCRYINSAAANARVIAAKRA